MGALDQVNVPEPDAAFEARMWARVSSQVPAHRPTWTFRQVLVVGAWAAVVGVIAGAGLTWQTARSVAAPPVETASAGRADDMRERVLLTALNDHFSQTEMLLVEVLNAPDSAREFQFERATADDLVTSGRLYRQTAIQNGNVQLAMMLDDIEGVLTDIAQESDRADARNVRTLKARIEDDDLLFKVRAVTTEVRGRRRALMQEP